MNEFHGSEYPERLEKRLARAESEARAYAETLDNVSKLYKETLLKLGEVTTERDALRLWAHKQNMAVTEIMEHMRAHGIGILELWDGRTSLPEPPK